MDLLVVVIILTVVALPAAIAARRDARLGIILHPGDFAPDPSTSDATAADVVDELALRTRRESDRRYWYQYGNS